MDWDTKEDLAVDYFIQAIQNREIRLQLHQRQPRTTMAWMIAEDREQGRRVRSVRQMVLPTADECEDSVKVIQEIRDMIAALGNRREQSYRKYSGPLKCFICDSTDYLATQCLQKSKKNQGN